MIQTVPVMLRPPAIRLPMSLPTAIRPPARQMIGAGARPPALAGATLGQAWKRASLLNNPIFALARDGGATLLGIYAALQARGINTIMGVIGLTTGVLGGLGLANDFYTIFTDKQLIAEDDWGAMFLSAAAVGVVGYLMFGKPTSPASQIVVKAAK